MGRILRGLRHGVFCRNVLHGRPDDHRPRGSVQVLLPVLGALLLETARRAIGPAAKDGFWYLGRSSELRRVPDQRGRGGPWRCVPVSDTREPRLVPGHDLSGDAGYAI